MRFRRGSLSNCDMEKVYYLLNSYVGMYITQAVLHSAIAAILADCAIVAWNISNPVRRQHLRMGVILLPIASFPLFQLINHERGSVYFRLDALMDSGGWLLMQLWGRVPVIIFFVLILVLTTLIFLFQELLPVLWHTAESVRSRQEDEQEAEEEDEDDYVLPQRYDDTIMEALSTLPGEKPEVIVIDDEDMVVFSSTGRVPAVYVSTGLMDAFDIEELRGTLSHEIAHIRRTRRPILTFLFVFRVMMFFNPVVLFEFRRAVQDEEEICDDEAVKATGNPVALAVALEKFTQAPPPYDPDDEERLVDSIEDYSHDMLIKKRVARLCGNRDSIDNVRGPLQTAAFASGVLILNYFIV